MELARDPTTVIGEEFEHKFRMPYKTFEQIVEETRKSGLFSDEVARKRGPKAHPLCLKVMAALRRLALGIPYDGLQDMVGISKATLIQFIPKWEAWFVSR